jgi:hypothetical protein
MAGSRAYVPARRPAGSGGAAPGLSVGGVQVRGQPATRGPGQRGVCGPGPRHPVLADRGLSICEKLRDGGAPLTSVFDLGMLKPACALEDLVDGTVFAEAVNRELDTWGIDPYRVRIAELPTAGRWTWLEHKGDETGTPMERLSKVRVAQRIVDIGRQTNETGSPRSLVNATDIDGLRVLHQRICDELGIPQPSGV